jgi:hypothetical protein
VVEQAGADQAVDIRRADTAGIGTGKQIVSAVREILLYRRAWLFADTQAGATASANLYSLIETAKANGVEPHAYLARLFAELPFANTVKQFEVLLPWNIATTTKRAEHRQSPAFSTQ